VIRIGTTTKSDLVIKDVQMNFNYLEFVIIYKNQEYIFQTKLLGRHNVFNLGLSIALSFDLGLDYKNIYENIKRIKSIPNRLELKQFDNIQIIDDAFNSNVKGFENALEVLLLTPYMKIIITPGVVELNESNYCLLDGIIETIINNNILFYGIENENIKYFINSFNHHKYDKYILFESFIEAYNYATKDSKIYKTILIENDLTDYYLGG
jgi:UDP-N-acetylmuramoyl-tripeptide--D-alanyl-D-alanine ligase